MFGHDMGCLSPDLNDFLQILLSLKEDELDITWDGLRSIIYLNDQHIDNSDVFDMSVSLWKTVLII